MGIGLLIMTALFACQKKYAYFFPDGTPDKGADGPSISIDTSASRVDVSKYPQARVFPGLVGDQVERVENYEVTLDLNYHYVGQTLRISVPPQPQFSTGLYAPPGELVEINVPAGMDHLTAQIGAWTDNLSGKFSPARDPVIFSRQKLSPGKNYMRNLYGGTLYILSPRPVADPVTLTFSGAVDANDFVLGETNPSEWWEQLKNKDVPWLELRSPNYIVTVPRDKLLKFNINDPTAAVSFWNEALLKDYYEWEGLTDGAADPLDQSPLMPNWAVLDIDISVGYGHSGFPVMMQNDDYWFKSFTDSATIYNLDTWGSFHEFGHNHQQGAVWSWSVLGETTNNLFIFKSAHRMHKNDRDKLTEVIGGLHDMKAQGEATMEFVKKTGMDFDEVGDPFFYIVPFLQLFRKAGEISEPGSPGALAPDGGWDFMPYLYTRARHAKRLSANDQDKKDFLFEAISDFTQRDFSLWFQRWGIQVSRLSHSIIADKGYELMTQEIWNYNPMVDTGGTSVFDPYEPSNWSVADFSTEENGGEGPNNGRVKHAIDGDINTFWHSQWSGSGSTAPHFFTIDMNTPINVSSFYFVQRQNNVLVRINRVHIETSENGNTWTDQGYFDLDVNDLGVQTVALPSTQNFRYFKITVDEQSDLNGSQYAALAEVGVNP